MRSTRHSHDRIPERVSDAELLIGALLMSAVILITTVLAPAFL
jgi:hypothetical protein